MSSRFIQQIYKSRKYILEILEERGFDVNEYKQFSIDELHSVIQNQQLDMLVNNNNNKKVYIKYNVYKVLRPSNIYDYVEELFNIENILNKEDDLIIINKDEPNETITNIIKEIWLKNNIYVSIINISRLQFNILKHTLVPKHTILDELQTIEFKKYYNITDDNMIPNISYFSPVSLVLGIRPGNICKIERPSKTSIINNFYRVCVI